MDVLISPSMHSEHAPPSNASWVEVPISSSSNCGLTIQLQRTEITVPPAADIYLDMPFQVDSGSGDAASSRCGADMLSTLQGPGMQALNSGMAAIVASVDDSLAASQLKIQLREDCVSYICQC